MMNIAILRLTYGGFDVLCFAAQAPTEQPLDPYIWRRRFESADAMLNAFESLSAPQTIDLEKLGKFTQQELCPGHLAGSFNQVDIFDTDLTRAGFDRYTRSTEH